MRQARIAELVEREGEVSVDQLADLFGTSNETIRRDLSALADSGTVRKIHGGAKRTTPLPEGPFQERMQHNAAAKRLIAMKAVRLTTPGETIFVDTGTTTLALAEELAKVRDLTVITNSARVAAVIARDAGGSQVYLLGGRFDGDNQETVGASTVVQLARFRADRAFLGVGTLDGAAGAMDYSLDEAEVARAMIEHAGAVILLADASKFGKVANHRVCDLADTDVLVCDRPPTGALREALRSGSVRVV